MLKTHALRIFPNGEFGVGLYKRFTPPTPDVQDSVRGEITYSWTSSEVHSIDHGAALFGSVSNYLQSEAPGFASAVLSEILEGIPDTVGGSERDRAHSEGGDPPLGSSNAVKKSTRAQRGSHGLTSYGKKMLRNGCWLLERSVCRGGVGMITATIPGCDKETQRLIVAGWSPIVFDFTRWLNRRLKAAGSRNPAVLGVTEIQEKRRQREGGLPLHLHLVFGSRRGKAHIVTKSEVASAWERAVCGVVPSAKLLMWDASTRVETVKKSVTHYLSKYLSKGSPEAMRQAELESFEYPRSWWFMVGGLKKVIKKLTVYRTDSVASEVWYQCVRNWDGFNYCVPVNICTNGEEFTVGFAGKMSGVVLKWATSTA